MYKYLVAALCISSNFITTSFETYPKSITGDILVICREINEEEEECANFDLKKFKEIDRINKENHEAAKELVKKMMIAEIRYMNMSANAQFTKVKKSPIDPNINETLAKIKKEDYPLCPTYLSLYRQLSEDFNSMPDKLKDLLSADDLQKLKENIEYFKKMEMNN